MARVKTYKRTIMSDAIEAERAARVSKGDQCDNLLPHPSHTRSFRMQLWLGGGYEDMVCQGV